MSEAQKYFENTIGLDEPRAKRLARAVRGFKEAHSIPYGADKDFWSDTSEIFSQSTPICHLPTLGRIYHGWSRLVEKSRTTEVRERLLLLLVKNEVEFISGIDTSELAPSQTRKSSAVGQVALRSQVKLKEVQFDVKRSRNYFKYLKISGPGSVLEIGQEVSNL
jgi:hypothetical protein